MKQCFIKIDRDVDVVFSPDDNGWYLQKFLHDEARNTVISKKVYKNETLARADYAFGSVVWV